MPFIFCSVLLLFAFYWLISPCCSLLFTCHLLLSTCCSLLSACCSLLHYGCLLLFPHPLDTFYFSSFLFLVCSLLSALHPGTRRCVDVITMSLCTSQLRRRYLSNETPNYVSMKRHHDVSVSVVRRHKILLECSDDVSSVRNNDASSVSLYDVSNKSRMKHPTTSHWYATKTSQWYVSTTSH